MKEPKNYCVKTKLQFWYFIDFNRCQNKYFWSHKKTHEINELKSVQVMVRLHIFPIFSFLVKMLSFLTLLPKVKKTWELHNRRFSNHVLSLISTCHPTKQGPPPICVHILLNKCQLLILNSNSTNCFHWVF